MQRNSLFSLYPLSTLALSMTAAAALTASCAPPASHSLPPQDPNSRLNEKVIYGTDSRRDLYQETNPAIRDVADSTVALIDRADLLFIGKRVEISGIKHGDDKDLCAGEPFAEQVAAAFCSGFLVAPDTVVTAGHCVSTKSECQETTFVFGYAYRTATQPPKEVPSSEVYSCKKVIYSQSPATGADFAVVQLDRPVLNHAPLRLRREGAISMGEELVVIGHPSGLPMKIADGAKVRKNDSPDYFVANLDSYAGNSGSAVFNARTFEVEGIIVRGEQDFEKKKGGSCLVSRRCADDGCRGEEVTRISATFPYLSPAPLTLRPD